MDDKFFVADEQKLALLRLNNDFMEKVADILRSTSYMLGFEEIGDRKYIQAKPVQYFGEDVGRITITENNFQLLLKAREDLKTVNKYAVNDYLLELFIRRVKNIPLTAAAVESIKKNSDIAPFEQRLNIIGMFPKG